MNLRFKIIISILLTAIVFISAFLILIPFQSIVFFIYNNIVMASITSASAIILTIFIIIMIIKHIANPISEIKQSLQKLNSGTINQTSGIDGKRSDEIGIISNELLRLNKTLTNASNYAKNLKDGVQGDEGSNIIADPIIGKTLSEIRDNLLSAEKEKKYSIEENIKTQWFQNGIADFSKLLQQDFENTVALSSLSIRKLIKHLEVEQGGIFIIHTKNDREILVLEAAYAFDKKKNLDTEFEFGESLVGKCAKEREVMIIDNLPEGYTFIGSGLGEDTPKSLLMIPMIYENNIFGVIEIASLYKIPEYKINFIKVIGERIAAEISSIKTGLISKTFEEDYKKQAEEIAIKEKEVEKTFSELQNIREKFTELELETKGILNAIVSAASIVFYDMTGVITNIKQKNEKQIKQTHFEIQIEAKNNPEWYEEFWNDLQEGKIRTKENYIKNEEFEIWLLETYTPILNEDGKPERIINIGIDITEQKQLEAELILKNK